MTSHARERGFHDTSTVSLSSALFLTSLLIVALSALAFWPSKTWTPPRRPALSAPIVFDDFVNPTPPAPPTP